MRLVSRFVELVVLVSSIAGLAARAQATAPAGLPPSHLAPRWERGDVDAYTGPCVHGAELVVPGRAEIVFYALSEGRELRRARLPAAILDDPGRACDGERLVGLEHQHTVIAFDLEHLSEAWRWAPTEPAARVAVLASDDHALIVRDHVPPSRVGQLRRETISLLDAATGRRVWHWDVPPEIEYAGAVADGERVYVTGVLRRASVSMPAKRAVVALDRRAGRELWRREIAGLPARTMVAGQWLVTVSEGALVVLGTLDGAMRALASYTAAWIVGLRDELAIVSVADERGGSQLVAVRVGDGARLWALDSTIEASEVVFGRDAIYVVSHGVARALDVATGRVTWEWGVGLADLLVTEIADEPSDWLLAAGVRLTAFARAAEPRPTVRRVIRGRIRLTAESAPSSLAEVRLRIYGRRVAIDWHGRFRTTVVGHGVASILIEGGEVVRRDGADPTAHHEIPLTRSPRRFYDLLLDTTDCSGP